MSIFESITAGKAVLGVVVAGASAFGAYNYVTTGCPLRTGCGTDSGAAVSTVAMADGDGCALGCAGESSVETSTDSALLMVSAEGNSEGAAEACCELEAAAAKGDCCCDACPGESCCADGGAGCEASADCAATADKDACCSKTSG